MAYTPEYIDLLNTIRQQESHAGVYLKAWAETTTNPDLKECLSFVAARETSHGEIFDRRIQELGFPRVEIQDSEFMEKVQVVSSDISDGEKIAWLKDSQMRQPSPTVQDRYEAAVEDGSVDPLTRSLLRWFIDVESDSRDVMGRVYAQLEEQA